ncbi:hypothetical protein IHV25_06600 [Phaeovibrio sulfidiphilus]|uniref:Peptidase M48 domain-containing protein n=1 Tax=Phaeovibrio sulfidiphilus TaxID=1220600 RepID=A0A8J6YP06_9PROT|nr:hypothetical protein [Phaeovibrio sulfidiphilus]MBE1237314.1 hypothetical protein [Phaeovibrio sulfidiphilus]
MVSPTNNGSRSALPLPGLENGGTLNGLFVAGPGFPAVAVLISGTVRRLEIRDQDGFLMATWDWAGVVVVRPPQPPDMSGLCLADRRFPSQQLVVTDPTPPPAPPRPAAETASALGPVPDPGAVRRIIRQKARRPGPGPHSGARDAGGRAPRERRPMTAVQKAVLACVVCVLAGTLALVPFARDPAQVGRLSVLVSSGMEDRWGTALVQQLEGSGLRACTGQDGTAVLNRLALHLAAFLGPQATATVLPVHSDVPQCLALPGGHIVVTGAFLRALESPDDVAAALALALAQGAGRSEVYAVLRRQGVRALAALVTGAHSAGSIRLETLLRTVRADPDDLLAADRTALTLLRGAGFRQRALGVLLLDARKNPAFNQPLDDPLLRPWGYTQPVSSQRMRALHAAPRGGESPMSWTDWQAVRSLCGPGEGN